MEVRVRALKLSINIFNIKLSMSHLIVNFVFGPRWDAVMFFFLYALWCIQCVHINLLSATHTHTHGQKAIQCIVMDPWRDVAHYVFSMLLMLLLLRLWNLFFSLSFRIIINFHCSMNHGKMNARDANEAHRIGFRLLNYRKNYFFFGVLLVHFI